MSMSTENPYVGPRTFLESDSDRFFGRDREARDLLALVVSEPLVLFYAQSGAGKSSLVNTRLTPELRKRGFRIFTGRVSGDAPAGIEPANIFVFNLLHSLTPKGSAPAGFVSVSLKDFVTSLMTNGSTPASEEERQPVQPHVLIIDQFEEIFRTHHEAWEKRADFFHQLAEAMESNPYLWVVLIMREDFIAALDPYIHLLPGRLRMRYYMQRLERVAALEAIKKPVKDLRPFEEGVAEKLVDDLRGVKVYRPDGTPDVQPGQYVEPVQLQVVCANLWDNLKLKPPGKTISAQDLSEVGDVDTSLGNYYADRVRAVAETQNTQERKIREWFGRELISSGGVRTPVLREPDGTSGGLEDRVVQALHDLVRAEQRGGAIFYELTHDRLVEPIVANNKKWEDLHFSPLQRQAALWHDQGRNETWLLADQALAEVEEWAEENHNEMTEIEEEFLAASRKLQAEKEEHGRLAQESRRARQRFFITTASIVFSIITLGLAAFGLNQSSQAKHQAETAQAAKSTADVALVAARTAEAESENLAAVARSRELATIAMDQMDINPQLAILLSIQAFQTDQNPQSRSVLLTALQRFSTIRGYLNTPLQPEQIQFSPDGSLIATLDKNGILLWNTSSLDKPVNSAPLNGHFGSVYSLEYSPDGRILASGGEDGSIVLWNTETGETIGKPLLGHTAGIWSIAFTPDGKTMATGSVDSTILLWDMETRTQKGEPLRGHSSEVVSIDISLDGKVLASGSSDGTILLWDVETGEPIGEPLTMNGSGIWALAFSPDGETLVSGGNDGMIQIWDVYKWQALGEPFKGHESSIRCLAISPDGTMLATGGYDNVLGLWDLKSQTAIEKFPGFSESIFSVAFSPDSSLLAAASYDSKITLVDTQSHEQIGEPLVSQKGALFSIQFDPETSTLASGSTDSSIVFWDLSDPNEPENLERTLRGHPGRPTSMEFLSNGHTLLSYGEDATIVYNMYSGVPTEVPGYLATSKDGTVLVYQSKNDTGDSYLNFIDTGTGETLGKPIRGEYQFLSDDGKIVVSLLEANEEGKRLAVWNTETGTRAGELMIDNGFSVVSTDGKIVAASGYDFDTSRDIFSFWDLESGEQIGETNMEYFVASHSNGKLLITTTYDESMGTSLTHLWDVRTQKRIGEPFPGYYVASSANGKILVTSSYDQETSESTMQVWDWPTQTPIGEPIQGYFFYMDEGGAFMILGRTNPDSSLEETTIWSITDMPEIVATVEGSYRSVRPASRTLVTASYNSSTGQEEMYLWDLDTGTQLADFAGSSFLALSPEQDRLVLLRSTGSQVSLRDISSPSLGSRVESAVNVQSAALSPDHQVFAFYSAGGITIRSASGEPQPIRLPTNRNIKAMSFSYDNNILAACDQIDKTTLWNLKTQEAIEERIDGCDPVFSPDGRYLAVSSAREGKTDLWDLASMSRMTAIPGLQVSFSPDSQSLIVVEPLKSSSVAGSVSGTPTPGPTIDGVASPTADVASTPTAAITSTPVAGAEKRINLTLWDISTKRLQGSSILELPCSGPNEICATAIFDSTMESQIIYSDAEGNIFVWKSDETPPKEPVISTGTSILNLYMIRLGQDPYLIAEDLEGVSTIWDMNSYTQVGDPIPGKFQLGGTQPDVNSLLYIDKNSNLIYLEISSAEWIGQLCRSAGRNINEGERNLYFPDNPSPVICWQWPAMSEERIIEAP